jgi:hypothetical protein
MKETVPLRFVPAERFPDETLRISPLLLAEEDVLDAGELAELGLFDVERTTVQDLGTGKPVETFVFHAREGATTSEWVPIDPRGRAYDVSYRPTLSSRAVGERIVLYSDGGRNYSRAEAQGAQQWTPANGLPPQEREVVILARAAEVGVVREAVRTSGVPATVVAWAGADAVAELIASVPFADELILGERDVALYRVAGPQGRRKISDALEAAYRLLELDAENRNFITPHHPIRPGSEGDREADEHVVGEAMRGGFVPNDADTVWVPKSVTALRRATLLKRSDALVYAIVAHELSSHVAGTLHSHSKDLAYQLRPRAEAGPLFAREDRCWREFRKQSLEAAAVQNWVIFADVSGFYDNISHSQISRVLAEAGIGAGLAATTIRCLGAWAGTRSRGIPQGYSASDLLAKLVLTQLDQAYTARGATHLRFVDDFRVFCRSEDEARAHLHLLSQLLDELGLDLNSAKSEILERRCAEDRIEGAGARFRELERTFGEMLPKLALDLPYGSAVEKIELLRSEKRTALRGVFEEAFASVKEETNPPSDLVRYLLYRLGAVDSQRAIDWALESLLARPELSRACLRYLASQASSFDNRRVLGPVYKGADVLPYQRYQILQWCRDDGSFESGVAVVDACKHVLSLSGTPDWLKVIASTVMNHFAQNRGGDAGTGALA